MPATCSITKYGRPSLVVPASRTRAMFWCDISASACRSDSKRAITSFVSIPRLITFNATRRRIGSVCSARYTVPIPPSPRIESNLYGTDRARLLRTRRTLGSRRASTPRIVCPPAPASADTPGTAPGDPDGRAAPQREQDTGSTIWLALPRHVRVRHHSPPPIDLLASFLRPGGSPISGPARHRCRARRITRPPKRHRRQLQPLDLLRLDLECDVRQLDDLPAIQAGARYE